MNRIELVSPVAGAKRLVDIFLPEIRAWVFGLMAVFTVTSPPPVAAFTDTFSGNLAAWSTNVGNWAVTNGKLTVNYDISCGSASCSQADLVLDSQYQPQADFQASVEFLKGTDPKYAGYWSAGAQFVLWQSSAMKLHFSLNKGAWDGGGGIQSTIDVSIASWNGSSTSLLNLTVPYVWNADQIQVATIKRVGRVYSLFMNGTHLTDYTDSFLQGQGAIGLHAYGPHIYDNFTVSTAPGAPGVGNVVAGDGQAVVGFTAPSSDGGAAIISYTVTAAPGGKSSSGTVSPIAVTGLTNGTTYTFTVTATNSVGTGTVSGASGPVIPIAVPGAPSAVIATAGNAQATIEFIAPSNTGGAAITTYTVTASPGGQSATGNGSPIIIPSLTNGTAYTFTVAATNSAGTGTGSSPSNSVTPAAPSITSGLVAYYPFAGNASDTSGNGYNGTAYGTSLTTDRFGNANQAYSFNGSSYIQLPSFSLGGGFTFSAWINAASISDWQRILDFGNGPNNSNIYIGWGGGKQLFMAVTKQGNGDGPSVLETFPENQWVHVVVTNDGNGTSAIYMNNALKVSAAGYSPPVLSRTYQYLGKSNWSSDPLFNGKMDDVRIYSRALSVTEIQMLYTEANPGPGVTVPGAPTTATATAGNAQATVSFSTPSSNGGAAIAGYTVTSSPSGGVDSNAGSTSTTHTITGLTNGVSYTFTVTATNGAGTSIASTASNSVMPIAPSITSGLVAYYPFNGNANDSSGNGNSATVNGATPASDRFGNQSSAYSFDGINDYIRLSKPLTTSDNFTWSLWFAPSTIVSSGMLMDQGGNPGATQVTPTLSILANSGVMNFNSSEPGYYGGDISSTTSNWQQGQWYHVVVVDDAINNRRTMFVNGVQEGTSTPKKPFGTLMPNFYIGANPAYNDYSFNGKIDDVRIYNRALSATEIQMLYTEPNPGPSVTVPGTPTSVTAIAGIAQATVSFNVPSSNGGTSITGYTVTSSPSGGVDSNAGSTATTHTITSLTNGVSYTFTVTATNSAGTGSSSSASNSVLPIAVLNSISLTPSTIAFGGTTIISGSPTGATLGNCSSNNTSVAQVTGTSITTGTTSGTATITCGAVSTVLTVNPLIPGAPTSVTAVAGNALATVNFSIPTSNGGNAISNYTATCTASGQIIRSMSGSSSPISVAGLTNNVPYTCTVTATNSAGTGYSSTPSNAVTPIVVLTGISLTPATIAAGASATITAIPAGALLGTCTSNSPSVALLNGTIVIGGSTAGTATITCGPSTATVSNIITVTPPPLTAITLTPSSVTAGLATPATITPTPVTATLGVCTSNNLSVATTNGNTVIPGATAGSATISCSGLNLANAITAVYIVIAVKPDAPTNVVALAGNAQATVSFNAPTITGGAPITSYTVTSTPGGKTGTGAASPIVVPGLTNGTTYTFTMMATNAAGNSNASSASGAVTPTPPLTGITLTPNSVSLGSAAAITAVPSGAMLGVCTSSNTNVGLINGTSVVTLNTTGTTTITCTNMNATLTVTPADLTDLTLTCPSSVTGGQTTSCSVTGVYGSGTSKAVQARWSSDSSALVTDTNGNLTAKGVGITTSAALTASYTEGLTTKTKTSIIQVVPSSVGACAGSTPYALLLTINGKLATTPITLKANDPVDIQLCMANFDGHTLLDVYVAATIPGPNGTAPTWFIASQSAVFSTITWNPWDMVGEPGKFMAKQAIRSQDTQQILRFNIPVTMPSGVTSVYAQAVLAGKRLLDTGSWSTSWIPASASFNYQP